MNQRITELSNKFKTLKNLYEETEKHLKEINANWTIVEKELLDAMVEEGVNSLSLEGIGRVSMVTKNRLSVNIANKPQFFQYLKDSGNGGLLKEDVNSMTLSAFLKTHMEELAIAYQDMNKACDAIDARKWALDFLNQRGASYFSEKTIRLKEE